MIELEKKVIRKELNDLRNSLSENVRDNANSAICNTLAGLEKVVNADIIAAYMPIGNEVDLTGLFAKFAEKKFAFPRSLNTPSEKSPEYEMVEVSGSVFRDNELNKVFVHGKYGIMEPENVLPVISLEEIDIWFVPGLGFDPSGNRIGRGGGIYDRLLSGVPGFKIGIGYEVQLMQSVPTGAYDQQMDLIVNEGKTITI